MIWDESHALLSFICAELPYGQKVALDQNASPLGKQGPTRAFAKKLGLRYTKIRHKIDVSDGNVTHKIYSDMFEAYIEALYLEKGLESVRDLMNPLFQKTLQQVHGTEIDECLNPVGLLQEALHRDGLEPEYIVRRRGGSDHSPAFVATVWSGEDLLAEGTGTSIKKAKKAAAQRALRLF